MSRRAERLNGEIEQSSGAHLVAHAHFGFRRRFDSKRLQQHPHARQQLKGGEQVNRLDTVELETALETGTFGIEQIEEAALGELVLLAIGDNEPVRLGKLLLHGS